MFFLLKKWFSVKLKVFLQLQLLYDWLRSFHLTPNKFEPKEGKQGKKVCTSNCLPELSML